MIVHYSWLKKMKLSEMIHLASFLKNFVLINISDSSAQYIVVCEKTCRHILYIHLIVGLHHKKLYYV